MEPIDIIPEPADEQSPQDETGLTRRDFFGLSWRVLAAFAVGQAACTGLRFLSSREAEGTFGEIVTAGLISDFPTGTITPFEQARFFLIRFDDDGFLALHSKCPHLACVVSWNADQNRFNCPCHGSEFERDGTVINPPAPRPLDRFDVIIDGDRVKVDTRRSHQRTKTDPGDLVYAPEIDTLTATPPTTPEATPSPTFQPPDR